MAKVAGTEFVWYQANRALQLKGGAGYMHGEPYEQILRDIRIFPIFEGANDVLRSFIALTALEAAGGGAGGARRPRPARPDRRRSARWPSTRSAASARGAPGLDHAGPRASCRELAGAGRRPGQAPARGGRDAAAQARQGDQSTRA